MRNGLIAISVALSVTGGGLMAAEEIDSPVIHNYRFLGVGYGYLHDIGDSDVNAHGGVGALSFEDQGFLLGIGGGYFWGDEDAVDLNLWSVSASVGYVVRLMENHINIIPSIGGSYGGFEIDDPFFGTVSDESWSILPGIGLSYAINNRFAINGGYTYAYNFDSEEDDHLFSAGAKFAVLEQVGLSVNAVFSEEFGFSGATAAVEFHY